MENEMEKSGCLQLTQEEFDIFQTLFKSKPVPLVKASAAMDRTGLSYEELKRVLDSGEYRIVED